MTTWAIVTGEYPPQPGGVSDYTWTIAHELLKRGDKVHVFAPGPVRTELPSAVHVHRLKGRFGPASVTELYKLLDRLPAPRRMILQFVPQSFGMRGINVPFMLSLKRLRGYPLWIMFHEFAISDDPRVSTLRRVQALGTRIVAKIAAQSADRTFVSTRAWVPLVMRAAPRCQVVELPIPSTIPTESSGAEVAAIRARYCPEPDALLIGHFGTYRMATTMSFLQGVLGELCSNAAPRHALLMGRGSDRFCEEIVEAVPELAGLIHGTGGLESQELANHLSACDIVLQPYEDGVTSRRTSLIAALALGVPALTTLGESTEEFWAQSDAVVFSDFLDLPKAILAIEEVLADPQRRRILASNAKKLYRERFSVSVVVETLRQS